ncbi:DMT family transporter [Poseidonibacter ostreae]|uniref:EamA family transporter n=1 Tax=Poseidonibacter ostreae TaxID=2654171 RepID=A0A6L4WY97_9BACT|nr:DMT family transporter [Poseidonibacter ostreae]KAB7886501.1 EamA family transporter [Poseidonibacter ostreae]KAB7890650.1 EamA family transporter [Poseidonibacter ostreae]KAB7892367.1 EamA family transporter [Poseidonibacter ostreae]
MTNNAKGLALTSSGIFIMSLESLFIKYATVSPMVLSFYLGIFIFISMITTLLFKKKEYIKTAFKSSIGILVLCAFIMGCSNIFFISAIKMITVANVVIIFSTSALFSSLIAYLFFREKITKNILYASFFMFVGLFVIFSDKLEFGSIKGNIFALLCTISLSLSFVIMSRYKEINRLLLIAFAGLALSIIAFFLSDDLKIDINNLLIIMFMGLVVSSFSRVLLGTGAKYISAAEMSLLMLIETIMAPIWVWIFLNEIPSIYTFIGGSIIIFTLIINSIYTIKRKQIA